MAKPTIGHHANKAAENADGNAAARRDKPVTAADKPAPNHPGQRAYPQAIHQNHNSARLNVADLPRPPVPHTGAKILGTD
jgi:hypothetical protein